MVHGHSFLHGKTTHEQSAQKALLQDLAPRSGHYKGEESAPEAAVRATDRGSGVKSELVLLVLLYPVTFPSPAEARQAD